MTFARHPDNPVLGEGSPDAVDSGGVSNPVALWDERRSMFRMWYEARDFFGDKRIGYAVSTDGVHWSRSPDNPVISPEELGLTMTLPLGKHSGRHAFRRACEEAGIRLSEDELASAFRRFKELADTRKAVTLFDVFEEVAA